MALFVLPTSKLPLCIDDLLGEVYSMPSAMDAQLLKIWTFKMGGLVLV